MTRDGYDASSATLWSKLVMNVPLMPRVAELVVAVVVALPLGVDQAVAHVADAELDEPALDQLELLLVRREVVMEMHVDPDGVDEGVGRQGLLTSGGARRQHRDASAIATAPAGQQTVRSRSDRSAIGSSLGRAGRPSMLAYSRSGSEPHVVTRSAACGGPAGPAGPRTRDR